MEKVDLKTLSDESLVHHELSLERDLVRALFAHRSNALSDSSRLGKLRKGIARARTEQRVRELAGGLSKDSLRNRFRGSFVAGSVGGEAAPTLGGLAEQLGLSTDEG